MKVTDMTVDVKAQLYVDKETAETCLKMVELYCNRTDSLIIANRGIDGTIQLNFEDPEPWVGSQEDNKQMNELKPCPFCGSEAVMQQDRRWPDGYDDGVATYEVICTNTDCVIYRADNKYFLTKQDAINAWNRRVEDNK